jgi:hypothetical protein
MLILSFDQQLGLTPVLWTSRLLTPDDHHTPKLSNVELAKGEDLRLRLSFDQ